MGARDMTIRNNVTAAWLVAFTIKDLAPPWPESYL
jgi:hypothetical protein